MYVPDDTCQRFKPTRQYKVTRLATASLRFCLGYLQLVFFFTALASFYVKLKLLIDYNKTSMSKINPSRVAVGEGLRRLTHAAMQDKAVHATGHET